MWLLSEKFMVFGVSLGWPVIMAAAACCALLGLLVTTIVHARRARRLMAAVLIPFVLVPPRSVSTRFTGSIRPSAR